jgi:hypothetical protein
LFSLKLIYQVHHKNLPIIQHGKKRFENQQGLEMTVLLIFWVKWLFSLKLIDQVHHKNLPIILEGTIMSE